MKNKRCFQSLKVCFGFLSFSFILFVISISWEGCTESNRKNQYTDDKAYVFSIPQVYSYDSTLKDSLKCFTAEFIHDASTFFIGKFRFTDTIVIDNEGEHRSTYGADLITGDSTSLRRLRDSLTSDGLQVIPDFSRSIPVNWTLLNESGLYYPIFVVNETNSDKLFTARDRYVSAIQEAKDRFEKWRPIESKKFDFIGNGRWALIIHPYEYALFITSKYQGPYQTTIRVRMRIGDETYLSKAFAGSIDEKQFMLEPGSYQYNEYKKDKAQSITRRFLGSTPVDPDEQ